MSEPKIPRQKNKLSILKAALQYLERGWNPIPVAQNKHPYLTSWKEYQSRGVTEEEVREWWTKWPNANIAILTGAVSGIVVIDADDAAGIRKIESLTPKTLTATTGGGGKHYYFKYPNESIPNAVRFLPGVDCRSDKGYVVAPPSLHKSKRRYSWDSGAIEAVDMPIQLLELLRRPSVPSGGIREWASEIPEGHRDDELTRRAGKLLQAGLSAAECLSVINAINTAHCKPPLQNAQVQKIVNSIAGREAGKQKVESRKELGTTSVGKMLVRYGEDDPRWTIEGWLPEASCGLVVAPPGSYKTWILANLAFAVATGRPFLGRYPVTGHGPVIFIQQEDPFPMLLGRVARMFNSEIPTKKEVKEDTKYELDCSFVQEFNEMPMYWHEDRQLNLEDKNCIARLEAEIIKLKPVLVTIDPLYSAVSAKEYMALGAQAMLPLKKLRDQYKCSFAIAHHTTVSGASSADRATIWGSQFLNAWLEFGWQVREIEGDKEDRVKMVRHFKSCENPKRIRLKFNITDWNFSVDIDEKLSESVAERIEEMILNGGGGSVRDIAEEIGCGKSTVQRIMKKLNVKEEK